jgi:hypothetical protein
MECDAADVIGAPASTSARRPAPIQPPQRWRWRQSQPQPPAAAPALSPSTSTNAPLPPSSLLSSAGRKHHDDFSIKLSCRFSYESFSTIAVDSTAFVDADPETNVIDSKIESALLKLANELGWADYKTRDTAKVVQMISFSHDHSQS